MPVPALRRTLGAAALCLVTVTGCSGGSADPDAGPTAPASASPTESTDEASTATPSPTEPTGSPGPTGSTGSAEPTPSPTPTPSPSDSPSPSATPSAPGGLRGRLLAASDVPGFNEQYRWSEASTGPERPEQPVGTCQRFAITSIGAERAVVRSFRPVDGRAAGTDRAAELVAEFPDELTARRAFAVLEAWRRGCAQRLGDFRSTRVGPLEPVAVPTGRAQWYLLTYGPVRGDGASQFFDAQGMALVGTRIAMVSIRLAGQDYNYERGSEPMVEALRRAAQRLS